MKNAANSKRGDDYLIDKINKAINELVYPKYKLQKAYNYYNGYRDAEQFRYLEENFGIGNPTSIEFTPLIRKHVDALIGEYLGTPLVPKVTCKDKDTLSKITREKELEITKQVYNELKNHLNNQILNYLSGKQVTDKAIETQINKLIEDIDNNFVSEYEKAAQNVVDYIIQSRDMDLLNKLKNLLLDLLVTGCTYYRVKPSQEGNNIDIEVLNPLNTFIDRNPQSVYVNRGYRAVVRYWMTKQDILNKYGRDLDDDAIAELEDVFEGVTDNSYIYVRSFQGAATGAPLTDGLEAGKEVIPGFPSDYYETYSYKLIPVYEVEWVDTDKEDGQYVQNRYEGVRISQSIYVLTGKSKDIIRTKDNPTKCHLATNGVYFVNRNNEPYSLVLACANLQDKYDLLMYFRDNIFANSGTLGDWLDLSMLPTILGDDITERIQKWIAYKKAGVAIVDTSQEGRAFNNNTSFTGFDDTIKAPTIQAFDLALQRVEETVSSITGVFRERLNGIEQKDAVSNVKVGIQNSYTITKHIYVQMDTLLVNILTDSLNIGKIVWKNGLYGVLVLGDKSQRIFTALPEYFTVSDYDIHVTASSQIMAELRQLQQIAMEFIKGGVVDADIIVESMTAKSLSDFKNKIVKAIGKRREETQNISQLHQQLEESQKQIQSMQQQNQQLSEKIEQLDEAKLQIGSKKIEYQNKIDWYKAITERQFKESTADNDTTRTEIERLQLADGNPRNDEVKNI